MNKKLISNHWFWFIIILSIYTTYDIYEHVVRPNDIFKDHIIEWALFSVLSQATMILVILGSKWLMEKFIKRSYIVIDLIGISIGVLCHVYLAGPIINKLTFPYEELMFFFKPILIYILVGLYLVIRGILWGVKKLKKSSV